MFTFDKHSSSVSKPPIQRSHKGKKKDRSACIYTNEEDSLKKKKNPLHQFRYRYVDSGDWEKWGEARRE